MAAVTEEERHDMVNSLEAQLGRQTTVSLMKHLPPSGWGEVATTRDLDLLEARLEARIDAQISARLSAFQTTMLKWMFTTTIGSMIGLAGLVAAITAAVR